MVVVCRFVTSVWKLELGHAFCQPVMLQSHQTNHKIRGLTFERVPETTTTPCGCLEHCPDCRAGSYGFDHAGGQDP